MCADRPKSSKVDMPERKVDWPLPPRGPSPNDCRNYVLDPPLVLTKNRGA